MTSSLQSAPPESSQIKLQQDPAEIQHSELHQELIYCNVSYFSEHKIYSVCFFFSPAFQMKEIRLYRCAFLRSRGMKPEMPQQDSGESFNHHGSTTLLKVYEIIHPGLRRVNLSVWADLLINRENSFSPGKLHYILFEKIISC